jgi:hypothetical protein
LSDKTENETSHENDRKFDFFYEKGFGYRAVHADGFIVSPNAKGAIAVSFYSERLTIPKHVRVDFGDAEFQGDEEIVDGKNGVFRQVEMTAFIDADTAEELRDWLERAIAAIRRDDQEQSAGGTDV